MFATDLISIDFSRRPQIVIANFLMAGEGGGEIYTTYYVVVVIGLKDTNMVGPDRPCFPPLTASAVGKLKHHCFSLLADLLSLRFPPLEELKNYPPLPPPPPFRAIVWSGREGRNQERSPTIKEITRYAIRWRPFIPMQCRRRRTTFHCLHGGTTSSRRLTLDWSRRFLQLRNSQTFNFCLFLRSLLDFRFFCLRLPLENE